MQSNAKNIRPTKKQKQLLLFIEQFISEHGYSPSYREIMRGCGYNSVATVALHVNSLIARGHLRKRDRSARSLEIVNPTLNDQSITSTEVKETDEKWLVAQVEMRIRQLESQSVVSHDDFADVETLVQALRVLGLDGAANSFQPRLSDLETDIGQV